MQLTSEEKVRLQKIFDSRLDKEIGKILDVAWEKAAARCQEVFTNLFTELMLEKALAAVSDGGFPAIIEPELPLPGQSESRQPEAQHAELNQPDTLQSAETRLVNMPQPGYVYLYCLAPSDATMLFKDEIVPGLPDGGMVRGIECGRLAAIVSSVPAEIYNEDALAEVVQDPKWLESRVTAHEQVVQSVMEVFPVIPMKFCTIFHSPQRVSQLVAEREEEFCKVLDYVDGKQEWGLKVYYKPGLLRQHVEKTSERIREAREKAEAKGAGAAYFMRKKMDELIAEEVEKTAAGIVDQVNHELKQFALEAKLNRLLGSEVTGRLETMVLNAAYFIDCRNLDRFREKEGELNNRYRDMGFEFVLTGPWPPYNFTPLIDLGGGGGNEQSC